MSTTPLLAVDDLSIGYTAAEGVRVVVHQVSMVLDRGERLGIVGESGCGKSTLALALLGFVRRGGRRLGGTVRLAGEDIFQLSPDAVQRLRGQRIALVPQNAGQALSPGMRIGDQIVEVLQAHLGWSRHAAYAHACSWLERVELPDSPALLRRFPHELSGGQQQRVAIAMALAPDPALIVLDEPTSGLDATTQQQVMGLLGELAAERGAALIVVSHDLGVVARSSDRMMVMYAGEVVEHGPTAATLAAPRHPYTRGLLASVPRLAMGLVPQALPGIPPVPATTRSTGCTFAPRCAWADAHCQTTTPALAPGDAGTLVRCHHWRRASTAPAPAVAPAPRPTPPSGATPHLSLHGVTVSYARTSIFDGLRTPRRPAARAAVCDVTLTLAPGTTLALVGESGSGKSTIARTIAGLERASAGTLRSLNDDLNLPVHRRTHELRRRIQLIFQNPDAALNPRHTVATILERPLRAFQRLSALDIRRRSIALLEQMRLGDQYLSRLPGQLSGGEKQRIAIARAFIVEPSIVLCDEVVSALDVSVQAAVLQLLVELQRRHRVSYLFIAHDLAIVRAIADTVAVLYRGHVCELGSTAQVYAPPFHPYTASLLQAARAVSGPFVDNGPPVVDSGLGCPFVDRCPRRIERLCAHEPPPWRTTAPGHQIRCHLPPEQLDWTGMSPHAEGRNP
jgi:peptide/nickel transport system ATP-binding protein